MMVRATTRSREHPVTPPTGSLAWPLPPPVGPKKRHATKYQIRRSCFGEGQTPFHPSTPCSPDSNLCNYCFDMSRSPRIKGTWCVCPFPASSRPPQSWIPALTRPLPPGCPCSTCITYIKMGRTGFRDGTTMKPTLSRTLSTLQAAWAPLHFLRLVPPHQPSIPLTNGLLCSTQIASPISTRVVTLVYPTLVPLPMPFSRTPNCPPPTRRT